MKTIIISLLLTLALTSYSQYTSFNDNFTVVSVTHNMSILENPERPMAVIGKDNFEVEIIFTIRKDQDYVESDFKLKSFKSSNCVNCKLVENKVVEKPVKFILDKMEEGDIWFIYKKRQNI